MRVLFISFCFLLLSACLPESKPNFEIVSAKLGETQLYIPKEYLKFRHTSVGSESALLQAWYPGAAPVPGDDSAELLRQGIWWRNIRILAHARANTDIPFDEVAKQSIAHLHATKYVGEESGLRHFTQPEGRNQDAYDVWLEEQNGQIASYITCSEELISRTVPQCSHWLFIGGGLDLKISYDRRLLSDWLAIRNNVRALFESFGSPESAKNFLRKQIENYQSISKEIEP